MMSNFEVRIRALFDNGPETPCRTVWRDGVEYVEVPMADLRNAMDPGSSPTVDDQIVEHTAAVFGGALEQHITNLEYRLHRIDRGSNLARAVELEAQLDIMRRALEYRTKRLREAL
jgi:hypothetical protein